jgi:hypothetical protein
MDVSVDMIGVLVVVVVFLMRCFEASPRLSDGDDVAASAGRVFCGNRIFRRDFPDAATIGMRWLIILSVLEYVVMLCLKLCMW